MSWKKFKEFRPAGSWTKDWKKWVKARGRPIDDIEMAHWHNTWDDIDKWVLRFMRQAYDEGRRAERRAEAGRRAGKRAGRTWSRSGRPGSVEYESRFQSVEGRQ